MIVPVVYFFYPETAKRSLEEMDRIFRKTTSIFSLVKTADKEPHMYGEKGELLRDLEEIDDDRIRRASVISEKQKGGSLPDKSSDDSNNDVAQDNNHREVS